MQETLTAGRTGQLSFEEADVPAAPLNTNYSDAGVTAITSVQTLSFMCLFFPGSLFVKLRH